MAILLLFIGCGIASAIVASRKGRDAGGWFFIGLLAGPIGLIIALVVGQIGPASNERKCPYCAEYIKKEAIVCKHCGQEIPAEQKLITVYTDWNKKTVERDGRRYALNICPKCGAENFIESKKCGGCGWKPTASSRSNENFIFDNITKSDEVSKLDKRDRFILNLCGIFIFVVPVMVVVYYFGNIVSIFRKLF